MFVWSCTLISLLVFHTNHAPDRVIEDSGVLCLIKFLPVYLYNMIVIIPKFSVITELDELKLGAPFRVRLVLPSGANTVACCLLAFHLVVLVCFSSDR